MKTQLNDGGPAFPALRENDNPTMPLIMASSGMSLRDWFAGQALAGIQSNCDYAPSFDNDEGDVDLVATHAYRLADAMLKAREERL